MTVETLEAANCLSRKRISSNPAKGRRDNIDRLMTAHFQTEAVRNTGHTKKRRL